MRMIISLDEAIIKAINIISNENVHSFVDELMKEIVLENRTIVDNMKLSLAQEIYYDSLKELEGV